MFRKKYRFPNIERHFCRIACFKQPLPGEHETLCSAHLDGWAQGVPPRGCPPRPTATTPGRTRNPMLCPTSMDGPRVCPLGDAHPGHCHHSLGKHETLCSAPPRWIGPGCAPSGMPTQAHPRANTKPYALPHLDGWAKGVPPRGCPPRPTATTPQAYTKP